MFRNYFTYVFTFFVVLSSLNILGLKTKKNIWLHLILSLFAVLIVLNLNSFLQRGFYYYSYIRNPDLSETSPFLRQAYSHGIWHNLYLGLGFFKNKWDIYFDDNVGFEHARRYDPSAVYPTPEYYAVMKKLYFKYLMEEPLEYIKNHIKKIFFVMGVVLKKNLVLIIIFLLIFCRNFLKCGNRAVKAISINPVHVIPLFIFFIVPVVTTPSFVFAIVTYTSFMIMALVAGLLEFKGDNGKF